jgi:spore coat protein U-like protein
MKRLIIAALAASTVVFATPAMAESVTFNGTRAVECSVTGYSGTINFGNLGRKGEASPVTDSGINVFCNQPFKVSLVSTNGYLKLQTTNPNNDSVNETNFTSKGNSQFDAGLDYGLVIPGVTGAKGSQYLPAGVNVAGGLGPIPAVNLTGLTATYDTVESDKPLLGGTYSDTVTLTLTPQGV